MWNGNQWIIRSPALFNTIATNEIFWLYYLEQLVILHSSNLYTYRHNFSISATLFQLLSLRIGGCASFSSLLIMGEYAQPLQGIFHCRVVVA